MLVHSRSLWITIIGLLQIILSFPLSYFVYYFIGQLKFFPFLNFIGVFVLFALGADDVFVAIDKWKNARIDNRNGSTEDIAAVALPDAAVAMFLTSITTSVAFFSTTLSTVAPLKCFAIFCGLLITFAYILCVVLVFPALCIYDKWLQRGNNCFCSISLCVKKDLVVEECAGEEDSSQKNLIRKILTGYYNIFHKLRWIILIASVGATVVCSFFASKLEQPISSDVRLLQSSIMYEQAYAWRLHSLDTVIEKSGGNPGYVIWGTKPADTGDHSNPESWSQLVLDETFDASPVESQSYLLSFCDRFFDEDFADYTSNNYECPMNEFNSWLKAQANSSTPVDAYSKFRGGATGIPMSSEAFNPCISAWSTSENKYDVLSRDGVLKIILISFQQRIRFDSPYKTLNSEWNLIESWMTKEENDAPIGVNKMFHSSGDFWWYDTNGSMLQAAYGSAALSLGFSGLVVLLSSRSFVLTLFSVGTIGFILTSTTAILVASGWTLGFLESVCFAILIGISCDFVLHFGHAYCSLPGSISRDDRAKYALIHMGPSILAAGFTTIAGAILMLFCMISFFRQFAQILFFTILMSTIGTFVVLLSLIDILGPREPRYLFDKLYGYFNNNLAKENTVVVDHHRGQDHTSRGNVPVTSS
jgi:protein dispatched 1